MAVSDTTASVKEEDDDDEYSATITAGSPVLQDRIRVTAPGYIGPAGFLGEASTVRWIEEVNEKVFHIYICILNVRSKTSC